MSKKKQKKELSCDVCENCDYFYRDQEMFRAKVDDVIDDKNKKPIK